MEHSFSHSYSSYMCGESVSNEEDNFFIENNEVSRLDVLRGRDKHCFNHEGNHRFRSLIISRLQNYKAAKSRLERSNVVKAIVEQLKMNGSRLLERSQHDASRWHVLGDKEVFQKISHALRDKYPPKILGNQPPKRFLRVIERGNWIDSNFRWLPNDVFPSNTSKRDEHESLISFPDVFDYMLREGSDFEPELKRGNPLLHHDTLLRNHLIPNEGEIYTQKPELASYMSTSDIGGIHPSALLNDTLKIHKAKHDEENDDEFMAAINTLDFTDLENHCREPLFLLNNVSSV